MYVCMMYVCVCACSQVTEEAFCEAAMTYAKGQLPLASTGLSPEKQEKFREANILMKVRMYICLQRMLSLYHRIFCFSLILYIGC